MSRGKIRQLLDHDSSSLFPYVTLPSLLSDSTNATGIEAIGEAIETGTDPTSNISLVYKKSGDNALYAKRIFIHDSSYVMAGDGTFIHRDEIVSDLKLKEAFTVTNPIGKYAQRENIPAGTSLLEIIKNMLTADTNIVISLIKIPSGSGTLNGAGSYALDSSVTVIAVEDNPNYSFANWTEDGSIVSSEKTYTFKASANRTLTGNFTEKYFEIDYNKPLVWCTCEKNPDASTYKYDTTVTLKCNLTNPTLYKFSCWKRADVSVSNNSTYEFNVNYATAGTYKPHVQAHVNFTHNGNGSVTNRGDWYEHNTRVTSIAKADSSYYFKHWLQDGSIYSTDASLSYNVQNACTFKAIFEKYITISTGTAPYVGGSASPDTKNYKQGDTFTINATPSTGYKFVNWTLLGNIVSSDASYSSTVITDAHYIANFEKNIYTVNLYTNGIDYGKVQLDNLSPDSSISKPFDYGTECTIKAIPNSDYVFKKWSDEDENDTRTITVTNNISLTAIFEAKPDTVKLISYYSDLFNLSAFDSSYTTIEDFMSHLPNKVEIFNNEITSETTQIERDKLNVPVSKVTLIAIPANMDGGAPYPKVIYNTNKTALSRTDFIIKPKPYSSNESTNLYNLFIYFDTQITSIPVEIIKIK